VDPDWEYPDVKNSREENGKGGGDEGVANLLPE
jgi:hypothetical protein